MPNYTIRLFSFLIFVFIWINGASQSREAIFFPKEKQLNRDATQAELAAFKQFVFSDEMIISSAKIPANTPIESLEKRYSIDLKIAADYDSMWYAQSMQLQLAHEAGINDTNLVLAIIDTGIFFGHDALWGSAKLNQTEIPDGIDNDNNGFVDDYYGYDFVRNKGIVSSSSDDNGHGTAMASIAAGRAIGADYPIGIAPFAKILNVKAFDQFGFASALEIARGIVYATERGANVINMSFGDSFRSSLIESAVIYANQKGVILVASAGNVGGSAQRFPAAFPEVIAVSWMNESNRIAPTANYGPHIKFSAPGSSVPHAALSKMGNKRVFDKSSGSSASSAIISGSISLLKMVNPTWTNEQILSSLETTALDLELEGPDVYTGAGSPQLAEALHLTRKAYSLQLKLIQATSDSVKLAIQVLGSGIKNWKLKLDKGRLLQSDDGEILLEQTQLFDGEKNIVIPDRFRTSSNLSISVLAELWTGENVRKSLNFLTQSDSESIKVHFSELGFSGSQILPISIIETSLSGWLSATYKRSFGDQAQFKSSEREGFYHIIKHPFYQSPDSILEVKQNQIVLEQAKPLKTNIGFSNDSWLVSDTLALVAERIWALNYEENGKNKNYYFYLKRGTSSTFETVVTNSDSTFSVSIPNRFVPKSVYVDEVNHIKWVLAYGGGAVMVFDALNNFEDLPLNDMDGFVYAAKLIDSDKDSKPEIWAHNRSKWAVFEFDGTSFEKKAEFENLTSKGAQLYSNEFQIPTLANFKNSAQFEDIIVADYDGDFIQITTKGDDLWEIKHQYEGDFYGTTNSLSSFKAHGESYLVNYRHSFPGVDERSSSQSEWVRVEFWKWKNDSLIFDKSLLSTDIDFDEIKLMPAVSDTLYIHFSPSIYTVVVKEDKLEVFEPLRVRSAESLYIKGNKLGLYSSVDSKWLQFSKSSEFVSSPNFFQTAPQIFNSYQTPSDSLNYLTWKSTVSAQTRISSSRFDTVYIDSRPYYYQQVSFRKSNLNGKVDVKMEQLKAGNWISVLADSLQEKTMEKVLLKVHNPSIILLSGESNSIDFESSTMGNVLPFDLQNVFQGAENQLVFTLSQTLPKQATYLEAKVSSLVSVSGSPLFMDENTISSTKEKTQLYVSSANVLSEDKIELGVSSNDGIPNQFEFDLSPKGRIIHQTEKGYNAQTKQFLLELEVADVHLQNVGLDFELKVSLPIAETNFEFVSAGNTIQVVFIPEDSNFELNDALVYPSPWVMKNTAQVRFAKIPNNARILIIDTNGRPVIELETQGSIGGKDWDGRNKWGVKVASGIYFYQIIVDDKRSKLKKMAIIR